jgi:toxin ParE1/3/4
MPRVIIRPAADADIDSQWLYLAQRNPDAARRFLIGCRAAFELLAERPGIGRNYGLTDPALADVRRWIVPGFRRHLIIYRPVPDGVEIIRVLHGSRDIPAVFERGR